ncbi:amidohydrolase [Alkalicoccobacillus murimartini]|uniref:Cytosine/adenosine deaminase-related metal-dependent hydrolase n=1 Tax=Alkalicoccobacillus murimartini TaxID=171685 RepID=A0ABT9YN62_9BACI|nr:amidohydrolase [Alkalicoccobacillus murimartini]MDQ0209079.1 cytosine/adenosine deaminase-related metal-dependent hydrolase [Alkalicoccobacillus murimartini]
MTDSYWLKNVRIETGFHQEEGQYVGTKTDSIHVKIVDGLVEEVLPTSDHLDEAETQMEGKGLLLLPSLVEKHCHLDKTLLGEKWRPVKKVTSIFERFEMEKSILPQLDTTTQERAERLLEMYAQDGVTHVRSHVDIYPEVGLSNLEEVIKATQTFEHKLDVEIVAFPQHGLLKDETIELLRKALAYNQVRYIGGVDPASVDGDIEKSLQTMVQLAKEFQVGIDLHLHDADYLGTFTMKRLAQLVIEADLKQDVFISHAFGLADIPLNQLKETTNWLAKAGITIITSVPISRPFPPVAFLEEQGVKVSVGCDNIFDLWSPFGNGDLIERVSRLAEASRWSDEWELAQSLNYITRRKASITKAGRQEWLIKGEEASFILVHAESSAEVVARRIKPEKTVFKGRMV